MVRLRRAMVRLRRAMVRLRRAMVRLRRAMVRPMVRLRRAMVRLRRAMVRLRRAMVRLRRAMVRHAACDGAACGEGAASPSEFGCLGCDIPAPGASMYLSISIHILLDRFRGERPARSWNRVDSTKCSRVHARSVDFAVANGIESENRPIGS
jgi:hypothetical protein